MSAAPSPEAVSLPHLPSPLYMAELGIVHLGYDHLLTGSRTAVGEVADAAGLPDNLRAPFNNWQAGGHYGEIGKTALVLDTDGQAPYGRQVEAVRRSAIAMSALGVATTVVSQYYLDRTGFTSHRFLDDFRLALTEGQDRPTSSSLVLPPQADEALRYAHEAGQALQLPGSSAGNVVSDQLKEWTEQWTEQLELSRSKGNAPGRRFPERLLDIERQKGAHVAHIAAAVVLNGRAPRAVHHLGAIGGTQEHQAFAAVQYRIHDPTTAAVAVYGGKKGLQAAAEMRDHAVREEYAAAQPNLRTKAQRAIFNTVTWFTTTVGGMRRKREGLEGRKGGVAVTARHLEIAVSNTNWEL